MRRTYVACGHALSVSLLLGCSSAPGEPITGSATDVPLAVVTYADGVTRMFVTLQLGKAPPFLALLDTGSSGLRIRSSEISRDAFTTVTDTRLTYSYGTYDSSITINGVVAYANLSIGALSTEQPIAVMLVESGGCSDTGANCRTLPQLFSEVPAILGVGMRTESTDLGVGNPIAQLPGHPPFVVHLPDGLESPDGLLPLEGTLRVGRLPTDAWAFRTQQLGSESRGVPLPNGTPAWNDAAIPCCVSDELTAVSYCLPSLWDTGNPTATIESGNQPMPLTSEISPGSPVSVTIGAVGALRFVVGADPSPGVDAIVVEPTLSPPSINLGVAVFRHYDVLFDQERGVVGLAQR